MNALILLLVVGVAALARGQSNPERQVRLEDIERENLKGSNQQQPQPVQYQSAPALHYQTQSPYLAQQQQQQLFAHPQYSPSQLSAYHQQLLFSQQQQPVYIPQHQPLPFPVMLIPSPYIFPQDVNSLFLQGAQQPKYRPATVQQIQQVKPFRASPQVPYNTQYQPQQYNAYQTIYQQKYAAGAKSTVSPPLKDNYVQQSNGYNTYKLQ